MTMTFLDIFPMKKSTSKRPKTLSFVVVTHLTHMYPIVLKRRIQAFISATFSAPNNSSSFALVFDVLSRGTSVLSSSSQTSHPLIPITVAMPSLRWHERPSSLEVFLFLYSSPLPIYFVYIYIRMFVCVCVCVYPLPWKPM